MISVIILMTLIIVTRRILVSRGPGWDHLHYCGTVIACATVTASCAGTVLRCFRCQRCPQSAIFMLSEISLPIALAPCSAACVARILCNRHFA